MAPAAEWFDATTITWGLPALTNPIMHLLGKIASPPNDFFSEMFIRLDGEEMRTELGLSQADLGRQLISVDWETIIEMSLTSLCGGRKTHALVNPGKLSGPQAVVNMRERAERPLVSKSSRSERPPDSCTPPTPTGAARSLSLY